LGKIGPSTLSAPGSERVIGALKKVLEAVGDAPKKGPSMHSALGNEMAVLRAESALDAPALKGPSWETAEELTPFMQGKHGKAINGTCCKDAAFVMMHGLKLDPVAPSSEAK
jgi:hypothetical protein